MTTIEKRPLTTDNAISRGGPHAFPVSATGETTLHNFGMTLRDYFAARALPVLMEVAGPTGARTLAVARKAYEWADAMLEARQEKD
jgi:hypothetical protein